MKKASLESKVKSLDVYVALSIGLFSLVFIIGLINSRPAADDYCFANSIENFGTAGSLKSYVLGWTPIYSSYAFVHLFLGIINTPSSLLIGLIIANAILILILIKISGEIVDSFADSIRLASIAYMGLIIWLSGGYSGGNLLWYSTFWISSVVVHTAPAYLGFLLFIKARYLSSRQLVFSALLLGGLGFAETVGWSISFLVFALLYRIFFDKIWNRAFITIGIILVFISVVSYKMPGTAKRTELMDSIRGQKFDIDFRNLVLSVIQYSGKHFLEILSVRGILAALLVGFLVQKIVHQTNRSFFLKISSTFFILASVQIVTASLAGVFSYYAPWHGTTPSIFFFFCLSFLVSHFIQARKSKNNLIDRNMQSLAIGILGLLACIYTMSIVENIVGRSGEWDQRWRDGTTITVPSTDLNGRNLVEDTESGWVFNCYTGWRD